MSFYLIVAVAELREEKKKKKRGLSLEHGPLAPKGLTLDRWQTNEKGPAVGSSAL